MIKFDKPENLNGGQLINELIAAGVKITEPPLLDGDSQLWLEITESDKSKAITVVNNHVGNDIERVLTVADKLKAVDISIDDLKAALGL